MGWIRGLWPAKLGARKSQDFSTTRSETKESIQHAENISSTARDNISIDRQGISEPGVNRPFQTLTVSDGDLPFISSDLIRSKRRPGALFGKETNPDKMKDFWIVVDDIVYDCTSFILCHPGGEQVILSFVGEDCSCMCLFHGLSCEA